MIGSRRTVPFVTELEPLLDILVHAQDITQPLGREWPMPVDAAITAADRVWSMPPRSGPGVGSPDTSWWRPTPGGGSDPASM